MPISHGSTSKVNWPPTQTIADHTVLQTFLRDPPTDAPYTKLKAELLRLTSVSDRQRYDTLVKEEGLGDRKPSELLRRMRSLVGNMTIDDKFFKEMFLERLPTSVSQPLTVSTFDLTELKTQIAHLSATVAALQLRRSPVPLDVPSAVTAVVPALAPGPPTYVGIMSTMAIRRGAVSHPAPSSPRWETPRPETDRLCPSHGLHLQAANCSPIPTFGSLSLTLNIDLRRSFTWIFVIADVPHGTLGSDFLAEFDLLVDCRRARLLDRTTGLFVRGLTPFTTPTNLSVLDTDIASPFRQLLLSQSNIINPQFRSGEVQHDVVHHIRTSGPPAFARPIRLAPERFHAAKAEFEHMLQLAIIRPPESPWTSPLHMVPKAHQATGDPYPVPHLQDFAGALFGKAVFSKIDLVRAFHQIPVAHEDIHKTAVTTPFGFFEFIRTSFGLRNAAQRFQKFIDHVLRDLPFVYAYIDDLLVASRNEEEHKEHLVLVFDRLDKFGVVVIPSWRVLGVPSLEFLGHQVDSEGCIRIRTTAYHPAANGMVERFHCQLKASLRAAADPENWKDHLPLVLLGIRSALKPDLDFSAAELLFGATVPLPAEMISPTPRAAAEDPTNLLHRLRQYMRTLSPVPPRSSASPSYLEKDLATCSHVYLRCDRVRRPLEPPYIGPFWVLSRGPKAFRIQLEKSSTTLPAASARHDIVNTVGNSTTLDAEIFKHANTPGINTPLPTPTATSTFRCNFRPDIAFIANLGPSTMSMLIAFAVIGIVAVAYLVFYFLRPFITFFLLRFYFSKRADLKKAGDWAIVTGATDGIGKAFAHELARDGMNVFLISRSTEKLTKVADEIQSLFKVDTKIFAADFTTTDFYENLKQKIEELPSVSILINNVGVAYSHPDALATCDDLTLEKLQSVVVCNVTSVTCMTRITLPKMLSSPPPDGVHRYIVNIASQFGFVTTPYLSVYAGTKAFVIHFTASLAGELAGTCVKVQTIMPGYVATAMSGLKRPSFFTPLPSTFASSALSMLGVASLNCGYLAHEIFLTFFLVLPARLRSAICARHLLSFRDKYYKRQKSKSL
ncbi:hypothetical protein SprV_0501925900 [Sparganum proliferum]